LAWLNCRRIILRINYPQGQPIHGFITAQTHLLNPLSVSSAHFPDANRLKASIIYAPLIHFYFTSYSIRSNL